MRLFQSSQDRDLELLSAYIDDELSSNERERFEQRLKSDAALRRTLAGLRQVQASLRAAPARKPPRSFTLTPAMAGRPVRQSPGARFLPALNLATSVAAILFAVVVASQVATSRPAAAPAAESQVSTFAQPIQAQAPLAPKSVTGTPPVTVYPTTVIRVAPVAPCDASQEPLAGGGGCSGGPEPSGLGGGGVGASGSAPAVSNGAGLVTNAPETGTTADSYSVTAGGDATAEPSTSAQITSGGVETGSETPAPADQALAATAAAPPEASAPAPAPVADGGQAAAEPPSPARVLTYFLGALLAVLLVASFLARRK